MKVFTFYYNRYETATTSIALWENSIDHTVLVHNQEQADAFTKHKTVMDKMIVTGALKGLAYQRNHALSMMNDGEWAVFMCDDFKKILSYPREFIESSTLKAPIDLENQSAFRLRGVNEISLREMFSFFPKLIDIAEQNKIHLIGFGLHDNPQNLKRKFTTQGLADGRFWLVKKSKYKFDEKAQLIDDVAWTAENIVRFGNVLVLNWCIPYFQRYTAGGFGTQQERIAMRRMECTYLVMKYYPLVQFARKVNWPEHTHVRLVGGAANLTKARKKFGIYENR